MFSCKYYKIFKITCFKEHLIKFLFQNENIKIIVNFRKKKFTILVYSVRLGTKWLWVCSHLNFRFHTCFKQGVPWHSGNYRVWIHSERRTWHDNNIQSVYNDKDIKTKIKSYNNRVYTNLKHNKIHQAGENTGPFWDR